MKSIWKGITKTITYQRHNRLFFSIYTDETNSSQGFFQETVSCRANVSSFIFERFFIDGGPPMVVHITRINLNVYLKNSTRRVAPNAAPLCTDGILVMSFSPLSFIDFQKADDMYNSFLVCLMHIVNRSRSGIIHD